MPVRTWQIPERFSAHVRAALAEKIKEGQVAGSSRRFMAPENGLGVTFLVRLSMRCCMTTTIGALRLRCFRHVGRCDFGGNLRSIAARAWAMGAAGYRQCGQRLDVQAVHELGAWLDHGRGRCFDVAIEAIGESRAVLTVELLRKYSNALRGKMSHGSICSALRAIGERLDGNWEALLAPWLSHARHERRWAAIEIYADGCNAQQRRRRQACCGDTRLPWRGSRSRDHRSDSPCFVGF